LDALDIVPVAGETVKGIVDNFYTDPEVLPENTYNLITELLVAQHVDDVTLFSHIKHGVLGLVEDGVMAIQIPTFLHTPSGAEARMNQPILRYLKVGWVRRTLGDVERIVGYTEGRIVGVYWGGDFPQHNMKWYTYHIKRRPGAGTPDKS